MGLAGNKQKQKIPDDPRNTKWSTDTSAPGFRLLSSMGWTPSAPGLGLAASQDLITQGGSRAFSKKISSIPIAKADNLGIGARGGSGIGSLRAMGQPATGGMGMGFVTAATTTISSTVTEGVKTGKGGEFGRLLERLNAAASQSPSPAPEETVEAVELSEEAARKLAKKERKEKKRKREAGEDDTPVESPAAEALSPVLSPEASPAPTGLLKNPRMAARSKHLRAKRMASMDATAMAEILGIAPPGSPSTSGSSSPAIVHQSISSASIAPVSFSRPPQEELSTKRDDGWPTAPPRRFPMFASSSSTGLAATFDPAVVAVEMVSVQVVESVAPEGETEKQKEKRQKRERKSLKALKKAGAVVEAPISAVLPRAFPTFASSSSTTIAATFSVESVVETVVALAPEQQEKRPRSEDVGDDAERKLAKKARKEEKRLKALQI